MASCVEQSLQILAGRLVRKAPFREAGKLPHFLDVAESRIRVNAAQKRSVKSRESSRDRLVRFNHEHLDERVGEGIIFLHRVNDMASVVEDQLDFGKIKVNHARVLAAAADDLRQLLGALQSLDEFGRVRGVGLGVLSRDLHLAVDERLRLDVGQSLGRANHGAREALANDLAFVVKRDQRAQREAGHTFLQRANAVGKRLRQHGNGVAGEVDAGRAGVGLDIERRVLRDEMRDIGDVHAEFPMASGRALSDGDRVVEILRVGRIDGEDELRGEILAVLPLSSVSCSVGCTLERHRGLAGLLERLWRKDLADHVAGDDRLRLDIGPSRRTKHLENDAFGQRAFFRPQQNVEDDLVAFLRVLGGWIAHHDWFANRATIGLDEPFAAALDQRARVARLTALEHFDHSAEDVIARRSWRNTGATIPTIAATGNAHAHAVAAHSILGLALGNEEIAFAIGNQRLQKAKAARRDLDGAFDLFGQTRQAQALVLADLKARFFGELANGFAEGWLVLVGDAQLPRDLAHVDGRVILVREMVEDSALETKRHRGGVYGVRR